MAIPVLLILAALWAAVLVPPLLRARAERSTPVGDFSSRLNVLGRTVPRSRIARPVTLTSHRYAVGLARVPGRMSPTQRRRRDVLIVLGTLVAATAIYAVFVRSTVAIGSFVLALGLLGAYVAVLVRIRRERERKVRHIERAAKVRYLQPLATVGGVEPASRRLSRSS